MGTRVGHGTRVGPDENVRGATRDDGNEYGRAKGEKWTKSRIFYLPMLRRPRVVRVPLSVSDRLLWEKRLRGAPTPFTVREKKKKLG